MLPCLSLLKACSEFTRSGEWRVASDGQKTYTASNSSRRGFQIRRSLGTSRAFSTSNNFGFNCPIHSHSKQLARQTSGIPPKNTAGLSRHSGPGRVNAGASSVRFDPFDRNPRVPANALCGVLGQLKFHSIPQSCQSNFEIVPPDLATNVKY